MLSRFSPLPVFFLILLPCSAPAADPLTLVVTLKDHRFVPPELTAPAGQFTKLIVQNSDPTAEEFESADLSREKLVPPKGQITLSLGRLTPGSYLFFGDYHQDTAQGRITVTK